MKTQRNILIAFLLNLGFAVFELMGGIFTGSVAILSDALHDLGDAAGIGLSWFLERKSKRPADPSHTYGYIRYSVLGGFVTTAILLVGSLAVLANAVARILHPVPIRYDGMILFAVLGVVVNLCAAWFTRSGDSLNQKAVNLHMLEDVLGWLVVLIGAVVMRFTDWYLLDPLMSIGVALFILIHAIKNMGSIADLFLEKTPRGICLEELQEHLCSIDGILDVHHIHLWSLDGMNACATMHIVAEGDGHRIKEAVRAELLEHGISHATLELEGEGEPCHELTCRMEHHTCDGHHHHHHHHHH